MDSFTVLVYILTGAVGSGLFLLAVAIARRRLKLSRRSLRRYLNAVAQQHEYLDMIDLWPSPRLEDIYIEPKFVSDDNKSEEIGIERVLAEKCLVILGDPGVGKTTLLRYLAYTHAADYKENQLVPVFVALPDLTRLFNCDIDFCVERSYPKQSMLLKEKLHSGQCLVLLDGLDEADRGDWSSIRSVIERVSHWGNHVVLSCRQTAYTMGFMPASFETYEILGFDEKQQRRFINGFSAILTRHRHFLRIWEIITRRWKP